MTKRDKIGVAVLIALFIFFIVALVMTLKPLGPSISPEQSVFVQQRIKNLEKSQ